jgi:polysaccharide transporter, PST family
MLHRILNASSGLKFNIFISICEKIAQLMVVLICFKLMANYLSITDSGKYAYASSLVLIFGSISAYAGSELIIPRLSKYHYLNADIITHGWYLRLMYAVICLCVALVICNYYIQDKNIANTFLILMLSPFFMELSGIFICWFMVQHHYIYSAIARFLGFTMRLGIIYLLTTRKNTPLYYFAYAYLLEIMLVSTCIYAFYFKYPQRLAWVKFKYAIFKILFKNGALIGLGLSVSFIFLKIDRYFIKNYLSFEDVGIYAMAAQLNEACFLLAQAILMVMVNRFIFSKKYAFQYAFKNIIITIIVTSIIAIMGVYYLAEIIIIQFIDARYIQSIPILKQAVLLLPLYSLNYVLYSYFLYCKKYIFTLCVWLLGLSILCILSYMYIYVDKAYSIIHAYMYAYVAMCSLYAFILWRRYSFIANHV